MYTLRRGFRCKYEICCIFCGRHTQPHETEAEARKEWNGLRDPYNYTLAIETETKGETA